jgi:serine/threonine protein kinase
MREIRYLQDTKHRNIVRLLDVVTQRSGTGGCDRLGQRDTTYLVLEYVEHDFESLMRTVRFDAAQLKSLI